MTPNEKVKELIEKMLVHQPMSIKHNVSEEQLRYNAKQCALICVDEMLKERLNIYNRSSDYNTERILFYQEVKQEIEKL